MNEDEIQKAIMQARDDGAMKMLQIMRTSASNLSPDNAYTKEDILRLIDITKTVVRIAGVGHA